MYYYFTFESVFLTLDECLLIVALRFYIRNDNGLPPNDDTIGLIISMLRASGHVSVEIFLLCALRIIVAGALEYYKSCFGVFREASVEGAAV